MTVKNSCIHSLLICAYISAVLSLIFGVIICVLFTHNSRSLVNISWASENSMLALSLTPGLEILCSFAYPRQLQSWNHRIRSESELSLETRIGDP